LNINDDEFVLAPGVMATPTLPSISALTRPFWDAAAEGRYILPRCNACGRHFFRPEVACPHCFAVDWAWVSASGHGTLYSTRSCTRHPRPASLCRWCWPSSSSPKAPACGSNVVGSAHADLRIGMALQVRFEEVSRGIHLPRFEPRGGGGDARPS